MQKNNRGASILLWSIFVSLIIMVSFVSMNTQIHNKIKSSQLKKTTDLNQQLIDTQIAEEDFISKNITKTTQLLFDNSGLYSLKKGESITFHFDQTTNVLFTAQNNSILSFRYNNQENLFSDTFGQNNISGAIVITGLSGKSSFRIESSQNFRQKDTLYIIQEKIGNKEVIQGYYSVP